MADEFSLGFLVHNPTVLYVQADLLSLMTMSFNVFALSRSPSFQVAGSYFPAWLIAIVVGVILMVVVRAVIARSGLAEFIRPPALVYLSMALAFTLATWLILI